MRHFLQQHLHDWRNEIPGPWVRVLDDAHADFYAVDPNIPAPQAVFPGLRRDNPDQTRHLLKPLDALNPEHVRVIVIGQDPYPHRDRATGQAFEDGAVEQVGDTTSPSLRRLLQAAVADLLGRADLLQADAGWNEIRALFTLPTMSELYNGLAAQGVIFFNAAWTFTGTGDEQLRVNLRLWRPVIRQVVRQLIRENPNRVVLALGGKARDLFNSRYPRPPHFVHHFHPQARALSWFQPPNPLSSVNNHLIELQQEKICWLPGLTTRYPRP